MANTNADVIRAFIAEATIIATLKNGMFGGTSDTNKIAMKDLATGTGYFFSDDTKQVLLAGAQTITGDKTFNSTLLMQDAQQISLRESGNSVRSDGAGDMQIDATTNLEIGFAGANVKVGNAIAGQSLTFSSGSSGTTTFNADADGDINFSKRSDFASNVSIGNASAGNTIFTGEEGGFMSIGTDTDDLYIHPDGDLILDCFNLNLKADNTYLFSSGVDVDMTAANKLITASADTGYASLRITPLTGTPSAPVVGDMWCDTAALYIEMDSGTKTVQFV